ncbi:MAG: CapA family protein [Myxococcota bacterium]
MTRATPFLRFRLALALALAACAGAPEERPARGAHPAPRGERAATEPPPSPSPPEAAPPRPTVLWVGGDVILSEAIRDFMHAAPDPAARFADEVLGPARGLWEADPGSFVLVNLETPVADRRRYALDAAPATGRGPRRVHFHAPGWLLAGLRRAGVHGVTLANNHALDQGPEGLRETAQNARSAGLTVVGAGSAGRRWPLRLGDEGNVLAVHAFFDGYFATRVPTGPDPLPAPLDPGAAEAIAESRARGDRPVAVVHVLGELVDAPKERWRAWAEELADAGAEAIVIHGTHVVLPVARSASGVPIVWGLGNLFTDMGRESTPRRQGGPKAAHGELREGLLVRLEATAGAPLALSFHGVLTYDERFARWHAGRSFRSGHAGFQLLPLTGCEPAAALPDAFPERLRRETEAWLGRRRDHLVAAARLAPLPCGDGPGGTPARALTLR